MTKKELVQTAYEQFYEYVEKSVDENGWVKREEHSGFIRNHFYLSNNIETKFIDKAEYWRPKTLEVIENNNGWIFIRSEEDLPRETDTYWFISRITGKIMKDYFMTDSKVLGFYSCQFKIYSAYKPITKPNPPLWTEEK